MAPSSRIIRATSLVMPDTLVRFKVEADVTAQGGRLMYLDRQEVIAGDQQSRVDGAGEDSVAVVGGGGGGRRAVVDGTDRHVAAENLRAIEIDHGAVVPSQANEQVAVGGRHRHGEHVPEIK